MKIAVFPGDGIGPEVTAQAVRVLDAVGLVDVQLTYGLVGAAAWRETGHPLPPETIAIAREADAILFGAVGDFDCDHLERHLRPEQAILGLRRELTLFANLRPATMFKGLEEMSALRPEVAGAIDMLIVRELNGDVYFGEKGIRTLDDGRRQGWDLMSYAEDEVRRIAHVAFRAAQGRRGTAGRRVGSGVVDRPPGVAPSLSAARWRPRRLRCAGARRRCRRCGSG